MMNLKQYLGLIGFLFVAAWVGFGFGDAILCALGGVIFYLLGGVLQGEIDLGDVQTRFQRSGMTR
jgi:hypothetical protein